MEVATSEPVTPPALETGALQRTVRASAILGSTSALAIAVGLALSKTLAMLVGPTGVGKYGLLVNLVALAVLFGGLGLDTGVVRIGAARAAGPSSTSADGAAGVRRAGWRLLLALAAVTALVLIVLRRPIAAMMLGGDTDPIVMLWLALAAVFSMSSSLQLGMFNMYRRVRALAWTNVGTSVAGGTAAIAIIVARGIDGLPFAVVAYMAAGWLVTMLVGWRVLPRSEVSQADATAGDAASLLRFGATYTASVGVSTGVQLVLPVVVLHALGASNVGLHRAAATISSAYFGVLLGAMAREYYPHLASIKGDRAEVARLVNRQQTLVTLVGTPIILGCLSFAPWIVTLIYSSAFLPAVVVLCWQLLGELLKFSSWTLAFVVLTHSSPRTYFYTELVAGATLLAGTALGAWWLGLAGLGMAYVFSYACYLAATYYVVRRDVGAVWSLTHLVPLATAFAVGALLIVLPVTQPPLHRLVAGGVCTAIAGAYSAVRLWKMLRPHPQHIG